MQKTIGKHVHTIWTVVVDEKLNDHVSFEKTYCGHGNRG